MPQFGVRSENQLTTCVEELQVVLREVILLIDFSVLEGHRGQEAQDRAYARGFSKVRWPNGKHNSNPSRGVDLAPWPIDWSNTEVARQRFILLAGFVLATATRLGIKLRWGGDWDGDLDTRDEKFRYLGHFE